MIIDSHAHYNNNAYKKPFRYLSYDKDGYALKEGGLPQLIQEMESVNIRYFIEPGVSLQSCEEVLALAEQYPGRIFPAMGIHPTRSIFEKWSDLAGSPGSGCLHRKYPPAGCGRRSGRRLDGRRPQRSRTDCSGRTPWPARECEALFHRGYRLSR